MESRKLPKEKVLNDLNMKEQTMEQVEKNFSAGFNICYKLIEYYGYEVKLVQKT